MASGDATCMPFADVIHMPLAGVMWILLAKVRCMLLAKAMREPVADAVWLQAISRGYV